MDDLTAHLLHCVGKVQAALGYDPVDAEDSGARFADLLDSMGMVEFLALLAHDLDVTPTAIEEIVGRRFATVAEVAACLSAAGLAPNTVRGTPTVPEVATPLPVQARCWLGATVARLPECVQPAALLDEALQRPAGWLERHAGIRQRRIWAEQDPLAAAADAGREALERAAVLPEEVGALLVAGEAPPRLLGLAAALHHRLDLLPTAAAIEVGGACTGFLAAVRLAQGLLARPGAVLVLTVEAPSRFLAVQPGSAGEAAALFGDGAAAAVLTGQATGTEAVPLSDVVLGADGSAAGLIQVERAASGLLEVRMAGRGLAARAVRVLADLVRELCQGHGLCMADLAGVVVHGGNGRMPALLARDLGLASERVWSATPDLGNLGSASLPVAWALHESRHRGPVAWVAVGAGLTWAGMLSGDNAGSGGDVCG
jgi:3-oxoacyl-[acyl-carrier-protein] synthase-3